MMQTKEENCKEMMYRDAMVPESLRILDGANSSSSTTGRRLPNASVPSNLRKKVSNPFKRAVYKGSSDAPKRPMSCYNMFFLLERERIVKGEEERFYGEDDIVKIVALQKWKDVSPKRKHRKAHGKISFHDLSKIVSENWKMLDDSKKEIFRKHAAIQKIEYKKAMDSWVMSKMNGLHDRTAQSTFLQPLDRRQNGAQTASIPAEVNQQIGDVAQKVTAGSKSFRNIFTKTQPSKEWKIGDGPLWYETTVDYSEEIPLCNRSCLNCGKDTWKLASYCIDCSTLLHLHNSLPPRVPIERTHLVHLPQQTSIDLTDSCTSRTTLDLKTDLRNNDINMEDSDVGEEIESKFKDSNFYPSTIIKRSIIRDLLESDLVVSEEMQYDEKVHTENHGLDFKNTREFFW